MILDVNVTVTSKLVKQLLEDKIRDLNLYEGLGITTSKEMNMLITDTVRIIVSEAKKCNVANMRRWLMTAIYEACEYLVRERDNINNRDEDKKTRAQAQKTKKKAEVTA